MGRRRKTTTNGDNVLPLHSPDRDPVRAHMPMPPYLEYAHARILAMEKLIASSQAMNACRAINWTPKMPVEFRSQFGEDVYLWNLFGGKLSGVFLEAGAYDGVELSISYVFEAVGWRGYLVEPQQDKALQCLANRPGSVVVPKALQNTDGKRVACLSRGLETRYFVGAEGDETTTIATVLAPEGESDIDFAVIDVEGDEVAVLDGLGPRRPRVLCVEDSEPLEASKVVEWCLTHGYVLVASMWCNRFFVRRDCMDLIARAERMQRA